ncbi:hypothetical protein I3842_12G006800 [Carya illinoinensis]|uniref:Uncharacterized protein n=1 Tax=Carya illinoinensis TaxID=32201 RepID=A0A922DFE5_CARIL|nr:hypothetical protein I3842_12G006800 [Carya illinoinensis]
MTMLFFYLAHDTEFFSETFGVRHIGKSLEELNSAIYLQVSIISQALIFVTRSRSWSFVECPGLLLVTAFIAAQMWPLSLLCMHTGDSPGSMVLGGDGQE